MGSDNSYSKLTVVEDLKSDKKKNSFDNFNIPSEELIRSCLYNWLGYGNINAPIWFLGIEEGGAEIWRNNTVTLKESLEIRSDFKLSMDFRYVWENLYKVPLESFKGANVWRYMVAFLLELQGMDSSPNKIREFIFKEKLLGIKDCNHFLGEMMPLPKSSKDSIEGYRSVWNSLDDYYSEVLPERFSLITKRLLKMIM